MLQQKVKINGPSGSCRIPIQSSRQNKRHISTFNRPATACTATAGLQASNSTGQQQDSSTSAVQLSVAAAAAAAVLLWPAQAARALPQEQLAQIKQTIDKDFQQGQVGSDCRWLLLWLLLCSP
jgi:hypothetical protein